MNEADWVGATGALVQQPRNFANWEHLVYTAAQDTARGSHEALAAVYEAMLTYFPLAAHYWVAYAEHVFRYKDAEEARKIYKKARRHLSYDAHFWVSWLKFEVDVVSTNEAGLLALFEEAREQIGHHFYATEFYLLYLSFLKALSMEKYTVLLHASLSAPLYGFAELFRLAEPLISKPSRLMLQLLVEDAEERKDIKNVEQALRLLYANTQAQVYLLFEFEMKLVTRQTFDAEPVDAPHLETWLLYLVHVQATYPFGVAKQLFERAFIANSGHYKVAIEYVAFLSQHGKRLECKTVLKRSLQVGFSEKCFIRLLDYHIAEGEVLAARLALVSFVRVNEEVPASVMKMLFRVEMLVGNEIHENYKLRPEFADFFHSLNALTE